MPGKSQCRHILSDGATGIGRSSQNAIRIDPSFKNVSGHHALIYRSQKGIIVQDLQSTNGTYVNGLRVTESELQIGDELGLGKTGPRFILTESLLPPESIAFDQEKSSEKPEAVIVDQNIKPLHEISMTGLLENKILGNRLGPDDMQVLLKDQKRLEKIIERGQVSQSQSNLIKSAFIASRSKLKMYLFISVTGFITAALLISFFAIRAHQYKTLLSKAKSLKTAMADCDKEITFLRKEKRSEESLAKKILDLREKQTELSTLKSRFNEDDFKEFYSDPLEMKIDNIMMRYGETEYFIPEEMIQRVRHHINAFTRGGDKSLASRFISRKDNYFPMIQRIFKENKLPTDLAYIAMLESGLDPQALSPAGAKGLWQLMPNTARRFGLKVNGNLDERTDPEKSTVAAAEYFRELLGMFGSRSAVMLCMAAYNAGEGRILNALRKIDDPLQNRDFWYIYRMGVLAEETNEYIPRVIALMIISESPEEYGVEVTSR